MDFKVPNAIVRKRKEVGGLARVGVGLTEAALWTTASDSLTSYVPISRAHMQESIDVLMKRFYTMPLPKGGGVVQVSELLLRLSMRMARAFCV